MPFKARLSVTAAFSSATTVEFHGAGNATHLGPLGIPNMHTETLTAADGDELVIRMVNVGCPTGPFTFHGPATGPCSVGPDASKA